MIQNLTDCGDQGHPTRWDLVYSEWRELGEAISCWASASLPARRRQVLVCRAWEHRTGQSQGSAPPAGIDLPWMPFIKQAVRMQDSRSV